MAIMDFLANTEWKTATTETASSTLAVVSDAWASLLTKFNIDWQQIKSTVVRTTASTRARRAITATVIILSALLVLSYTPVYPAVKSQASTVANNIAGHDRPLVLYAYAESATSRLNLEYFMQKGLHGNADFVFIFNGETNDTALLPELPNIEIVQRNNTCYDLGAFGEVLRQDNRWKKYKRFILMNSSVRGPFFPNYVRPCWTDMFLGRLNDRVKLVGTSIYCWPAPHLQSMVLATDSIGMGILLDPELATSLQTANKYGGKDDPVGLSACYPNRYKAIHGEIGSSGLVLSQGYQLDAMITSYNADDMDTAEGYCTRDERNYKSNTMEEGKYFGTNSHPYETVFMKSNRAVNAKILELMTEWHMARSWSSWDLCSA